MIPASKLKRKRRSDSALGLLSTPSFPVIVGTADAMLKAAEVTLVGYEKIGSGDCTVIVRGNIADVRLAVEEGSRLAEKLGQTASKLVIARPMPNLEAVFPIGSHLVEIAQEQRGFSRLSNQSIGLLETRGFPAMVGAADAMLKSANVQLSAYETVGAGLCTAMVRGSIANVAVAIEAGMFEAEKIGELNAVMVIPRVLDDLETMLPVAKCWIEKPLPLLFSNKVKEKEKELVELQETEKELVELQDLEKLTKTIEKEPGS